MHRVPLVLLTISVFFFAAGFSAPHVTAGSYTKARPKPKVLPSLRFGMSLAEANKVLQRVLRDEDVKLLTSITTVPLGLDVMDGAALATLSTGITMATYHGYEPLFFYQDRLIAIKRTIRQMNELLALKQEFPKGRFSFHYFPGQNEQVRVFQANDAGRVIFTNHQNDVLIFDAALRSHVLAGLTGSYCWHAKTFGPNQNGFANEYATCVRYRGDISRGALSQDMSNCQRFCANTPAGMANPRCGAICQDAYAKAQR